MPGWFGRIIKKEGRYTHILDITGSNYGRFKSDAFKYYPQVPLKNKGEMVKFSYVNKIFEGCIDEVKWTGASFEYSCMTEEGICIFYESDLMPKSVRALGQFVRFKSEQDS